MGLGGKSTSKITSHCPKKEIATAPASKRDNTSKEQKSSHPRPPFSGGGEMLRKPHLAFGGQGFSSLEGGVA
jgi:hypothetical protein